MHDGRRTSKKSTRYFWAAVWILGIGSVAFVGSIVVYWLSLRRFGGLSDRSEDWGSFGAYVSGMAGTVIALATLGALAITLALQARESESTHHTAARQMFDSTFFRLLEQFNDVLQSISVKRLVFDTGEYEVVEGRFAISSIYQQMRARYPVNPEAEVYGSIVDMFGQSYREHESMLGPYFRTLFHVFKFIDQQKDLEDQEKIDYANIARAQLSRYELALMFYDCLTDYGTKFKPLIEKYGILKHVNEFDLADRRQRYNPTLYNPDAFRSQEEREGRAESPKPA